MGKENLPKDIIGKLYKHADLGEVIDCYLKSDVDIFGIESSVTSPIPVENLSKGYTIIKEGIIFND